MSVLSALQETWLVDQPEDVQLAQAALQDAPAAAASSIDTSSSRITTSLQYANHHYPDASSLQPTRIVCVMGSAVTGQRVGLADVLKGRMSLAGANYAWFVQSSYQVSVHEPCMPAGNPRLVSDAICPGSCNSNLHKREQPEPQVGVP
jgi:hypothetical protein